MKPLTFLLLLAIPLPLFAQRIDASKLQDGTYSYDVVVKGGVIVSMTPAPTIVLQLGVPGPTPPPGQPTDFTKVVQSLTKLSLDSGGTSTTAAALSSVYSLVASNVASGDIPQDQAFLAIKLATDTVLNNVADKDKWTKWRTDLSNALETLRQEGVLQLPKAFVEVSQGIDLALGKPINPSQILEIPPTAANAKLFEGIDLIKLIELIKLIIELLNAFKP